jgi:hypothetical protein
MGCSLDVEKRARHLTPSGRAGFHEFSGCLLDNKYMHREQADMKKVNKKISDRGNDSVPTIKRFGKE